MVLGLRTAAGASGKPFEDPLKASVSYGRGAKKAPITSCRNAFFVERVADSSPSKEGAVQNSVEWHDDFTPKHPVRILRLKTGM